MCFFSLRILQDFFVGLRIGRPGFDPRPGRCVVSLSKRHLLPKILVIPRNSWLRLNMTEKLFTRTLNKNQNKNKTAFFLLNCFQGLLTSFIV